CEPLTVEGTVVHQGGFVHGTYDFLFFRAVLPAGFPAVAFFAVEAGVLARAVFLLSFLPLLTLLPLVLVGASATLAAPLDLDFLSKIWSQFSQNLGVAPVRTIGPLIVN